MKKDDGNVKKNKGQGMVEFALTFPIFIILVIGIFEMSWLFYFYNSINTASRAAARYGAALGNNVDGVPRYKDCAGIRDTVKRIAWFAGINDSDVIISFDSGPGTTATQVCNSLPISSVNLADRIQVTVTGHYTPLVNVIAIPPLPIRTKSTYTIMKDISISPYGGL